MPTLQMMSPLERVLKSLVTQIWLLNTLISEGGVGPQPHDPRMRDWQNWLVHLPRLVIEPTPLVPE